MTTHVIQIINPFDTTHQIIIPVQISQITSYFVVKKPSLEENDDQDILKVEVTPWDLSSPEFSRQEQSVLDYRGWFVIPNAPERGKTCTISVTWYAYDAEDILDDGNFATVLESYHHHFVANIKRSC